MRKLVAERLFAEWVIGSLALLAVVALASTLGSTGAKAQGRGEPSPGFVAPGVPEMPNPPGPAPKHDLNGTWIGPQKLVSGPFPAMTPAGEAKFKLNRPVDHVGDKTDQVQATNDPFIICDPLGLPRELRNPTLNGRGGVRFEMGQDRMLMLYELQRVWREIWMGDRQLPEKVDAAGAPDSTYYGYSVGHWDGDNVFAIDTTGVDPRSWLDEFGHPHTSAAKIQERYTRVDQYNLELAVTVDDPKFYTKPFQLLKEHLYWKKDQDLDEILCIPSIAIEYQDKLANPSGWGPGGAPAK